MSTNVNVNSRFNTKFVLPLKGGQLSLSGQVQVVTSPNRTARTTGSANYAVLITLGAASALFSYSSFVRFFNNSSTKGVGLSAVNVWAYIKSRNGTSDHSSFILLDEVVRNYVNGTVSRGTPAQPAERTLVGAISAAQKAPSVLSRKKATELADRYLSTRTAFQAIQNEIQALAPGDQQAVSNLIKTFETLR
jgi:hypothetical protein